MTKAEMIAKLQDREAESWLNAVTHKSIYTRGMTAEEAKAWESNDTYYRRLIARWAAISDMLDELGIRSDDEHPANLEAAGLICRG